MDEARDHGIWKLRRYGAAIDGDLATVFGDVGEIAFCPEATEALAILTSRKRDTATDAYPLVVFARGRRILLRRIKLRGLGLGAPGKRRASISEAAASHRRGMICTAKCRL